jgi:hypothetical protein
MKQMTEEKLNRLLRAAYQAGWEQHAIFRRELQTDKNIDETIETVENIIGMRTASLMTIASQA